YTDTGLTNGTTYFYVVTAVNGSGESGNSNQAIATPQPPAPPAPTGLTPTPGDRQVGLTWNAVSGAASYNVKRATVSGGPYTTISGAPGSWTSTSFSDTTAAAGATYYYVVTAQNGAGESGSSNEASATLRPAVPTGLLA